MFGDQLDKLAMTIETRGKITSSLQSTTLYKGESVKIKRRQKGQRTTNKRERYGLIFKPVGVSICYILGI